MRRQLKWIRSLGALTFTGSIFVGLVGAAPAQDVPTAGSRVTAQCPKTPLGEELIVCGRRERSPYRLPEPPEGFDPKGPVDSVSRERNRLLDLGATGIHSCSTVGPGGWTGCDLIRWKGAQEQWAVSRPNDPTVSFHVGPLKRSVID